jgi:hypothetical protein
MRSSVEDLTLDQFVVDDNPRDRPRKRGSGATWRVDDNGRECAQCGVYKPWSEYSIASKSPRGRHSYCSPCKRQRGQRSYQARSGEINTKAKARRITDGDRIRARDRAAYQRNADKIRARGRAYYARNVEKRREYSARYRREHPEIIAVQQLRISARRCGQDPDLIEAHFLSHNGLCDICGRPPQATEKRPGRLNIDHDHKTGEFRGLLCGMCNRAIGLFGDDPKTLTAAIEYLLRQRGEACPEGSRPEGIWTVPPLYPGDTGSLLAAFAGASFRRPES